MAWGVMAIMGIALILVITAILRAFQGKPLPDLKGWQDYAIPILTILGLGASIYLTYVEITHTRALCGPVGDCNAVQSSPYAKLFGLVPIGLVGALGGTGNWLVQYLWAHPTFQTQLIMTGGAGAQNAGASWRSLSYGTRAVFHSGPEAMGVGMVTGILAGVAALYILSGLLFFWRAKCCLRKKVFG